MHPLLRQAQEDLKVAEVLYAHTPPGISREAQQRFVYAAAESAIARSLGALAPEALAPELDDPQAADLVALADQAALPLTDEERWWLEWLRQYDLIHMDPEQSKLPANDAEARTVIDRARAFVERIAARLDDASSV